MTPVSVHSTRTPPVTGLTLSSGGIKTTKAILTGLEAQRYRHRLLDAHRQIDSNDSEVFAVGLGVVHCNRVEKLWRSEGRQVLSMHPGLVDEVKMATSAKIIPEVFATLPYRDPLVVFPGGINIPSWKDNETMRCLGFFTHGRIDHTHENSGMVRRRPGMTDDKSFDEATTVVSTHDADSEVFAVIIVNIAERPGQEPMYEYNRITFRLDKPSTLKEIVDTKIANYGWDSDRSTGWRKSDPIARQAFWDSDRSTGWRKSDPIARQAFMRAQLSLALGSVMYLCSTVLDAEPVPSSRIKRVWDAKLSKVPNLINVGWRIGPALSAARAEARQKEATSQPGRTLPPHQRRAHFKTVWTGQGRTTPKTVFIAPYWVHKEQMRLVDTKTVRAVR